MLPLMVGVKKITPRTAQFLRCLKDLHKNGAALPLASTGGLFAWAFQERI
jgi:hypothetical protein